MRLLNNIHVAELKYLDSQDVKPLYLKQIGRIPNQLVT